VKPRLSKIVWTDWPALFCTFAIPAIWLISAAFPLVSPGARFGAVELFAVAIPATLITAGVFAWRVWRIHWFFAYGVPTIGRILGVKIVRDRAD
jgi:hypothetical protein